LHELARRGLEVDRPARNIHVSAFSLTPTEEHSVWRFDVECSVGTYVRVLLSDLAHRLGTIGHLVELRRLASGPHSVADAWTLETLTDAVTKGTTVLAPPSAFVTGLEHVTLSEDATRAMRMGQRVTLEETYHTGEIAAMDPDGALVGILSRRHDSWKPELVLSTSDESTRG
jgi:tRNA pseudouridine55 synthase